MWIDVAPELRTETDYWYLAEHLPDRIQVGGYLRARRYQSAGGSSQYLTLFEAKTPQDLASEGYLSLVKSISDQSKRIRAGFSNVARNTFTVVASVGAGVGALMASFRLEPHSQTDDKHSFTCLHQIAEQASFLEGIVGCHVLVAMPEVRAKMDQYRVTGAQDALVECALLIEATDQRDLDKFFQKVRLQESLSRGGWKIDQSAVYQLMYALTQ